MSKKQKTYTVKASAWIDIELKIEASSRTDAYNKLQDRKCLDEILETSGVKLPMLYGVQDYHGNYSWNTYGKKPKQYSPYIRGEVVWPIEEEYEHPLAECQHELAKAGIEMVLPDE